MSKDETGAFRKGKKGHRGQIVYLLQSKDKKGKERETVEVRPVYVFESRAKVEAELKRTHGSAVKIYGFFQSGCLIKVDEEVAHEKMVLPPGTYLLNTIISKAKCAKVTTPNGKTYPEIPLFTLSNLIASGLKRLD